MKQITSQFKGYTMYIDDKGNLVVHGVGKFNNFVALFYLTEVRELVKQRGDA